MTVFDPDTIALENTVTEFEAAWSPTDRPAIRDYLPKHTDAESYQTTLWELVETDLELRIKASENARVEEYFDEFPTLLDNQKRLVEFIYNEYRLRSRREPDLTSETYLERFPILTGQLQSLFETHRSSSSGSTDGSSAPSRRKHKGAIGNRTSRSGRFRLLEPHEEGGLGKVWVAYDSELDRQVALKEIRIKYADDETSRVRFATEALVTSSLEHPGIVPVYGFGEYADGRPYYTMRFVRGISYRDAIREFHKTDWSSRPSGARLVEMRRLIGHFLVVCNTMHYAHQRGVLHRDLKPGNIMLGDYGETLVVDWGLAKPMDQASDESTLVPLARDAKGDDRATRLGKALGSPAYMSPEQARGEHDKLGPETDVYSLGATLYTLLTNERPIRKGAQTEEMLESVQTGDWPKPGAIRNNVSKSLEAICLKAMALKPSDRYATAKDLADEIERYLADQPVLAIKDTFARRMSRLIRRNHRLVQVTTIALIAVATTSFIAALTIDEQRRVAEASAQLEAQARKAALENKIEAQRFRLSDTLLHELLDKALELEHADHDGGDISLVEALDRAVSLMDDTETDGGRTYLAFAKRYELLGSYDRAIQCSQEAVALLSASEGPAADDTLSAMQALADALEQNGDIERSADVREQALANQEYSLREAGEDLNSPVLLESHGTLAEWYASHADFANAIRHQKQAYDIVDSQFGSSSYQALTIQVNLASYLRQAGAADKAKRILQEAQLALPDDDTKWEPLRLNIAAEFAALESN